QKNRLEDRLLFELELDNDLRDVEVPKLILQPLVENSIKYAMRKSDQILTIKVYTYLADPEDNEIVRQIDHEGPVACITVENDGEGMNEEQLENYWSLLNAKNVEATSIGIKNVVKRLQLLFDNKCRFEVESSPENGTITRLYLPVAGGNDEDRNH
ncbi:MAG: hypothetical protein KBS83_08310, partial [Lachnospiraceae bacterium]|nr:hypothetical protein [Candidatus Equihabitans merdae]